MNVFSTLKNPRTPIALTEAKYHRETNRVWPYVFNDGDTVKSYALCPACVNPVLLVNRNIATTNAEILYAKHTGYSVKGLGEHNQQDYEECPLHNPERFDSKARRSNLKRNNEVRDALMHHTHLIIRTLESSSGVKFSDNVVENMLRDFGASRGFEYKAITLYNLPFGFAYMTEGRDLFGCNVDQEIASAISQKSSGFYTERFGKVCRKKDARGTAIKFYFNNHRLGESSVGNDSIDLVIVEIDSSSSRSDVLITRTLEYNSEFFFSTYMRQERLRLLALQYL
ncbi:hypothetical protein [Pseudomonas viridiflava]|uniref:hypothetical protein n=1 Tax=Pseudomonas viridiflava TaxID=33069 RepID=UPI002EB826E6|nr:hypothetical protein [Pseudomonas viridiflava]